MRIQTKKQFLKFNAKKTVKRKVDNLARKKRVAFKRAKTAQL